MGRYTSIYKVQALLFCGLLLLTGCENGNIFGGLHKRGDSGNIEYLLSDATAALNEGDYSGAQTYYERVLSQDSDNAQALYGSAVAAIGASGLNFGQIVTNMIKGSSVGSSSEATGLSDFLARSRNRVTASATDPNSILNGIDFESLNNHIDLAICRLGRIVQGQSDGSIPSDDVNVLVNLATLHVIRAVSKPRELDIIDITNIGGEYDVVLNNVSNAMCDGSAIISGSGFDAAAQRAFVTKIMEDVASAYVLINRAALKINAGSDQLLSKLRTDVAEAVDSLLTSHTSFSDCIARFNDAGITSGASLNSFDYDSHNPLSGC